MEEFNLQEQILAKKINISFCLPIYNVAKWVEACIDSILCQDLTDINCEVVCVDDCSTDNSLSVLRELSMKHPEIIIFESQKNEGVSATRNKAIKAAHGEFIWFVDPDDLLYPGSIKFLYNAISSGDENVIIANYMKIDEDAVLDDFKDVKTNYSVSRISSQDNIGAKNIQEKNTGYGMCSTCCAMFRKSFLIDNDLYFRENIHFQEDTVFYYEFVQKTESVLSAECLCYLYRQRSTSVVHTRTVERTKKVYTSIYNMLQVYEEYRSKGVKNKKTLQNKIHQSKEKVAQVLSMITDTQYVKEQIKELRKRKEYPYKLRWGVLRDNLPLSMRLALFLLPFPPVFWIIHRHFKRKVKATK